MLHQDLGDNSATITVTISASKMSLITSMQKPPQHLAKSRGNEAASQRNEKTSGSLICADCILHGTFCFSFLFFFFHFSILFFFFLHFFFFLRVCLNSLCRNRPSPLEPVIPLILYWTRKEVEVTYERSWRSTVSAEGPSLRLKTNLAILLGFILFI